MSGVHYDGIEKRFEAFTALHALNLNIPDRQGTTPLGHARARGYREMVRILEAAGAR